MSTSTRTTATAEGRPTSRRVPGLTGAAVLTVLSGLTLVAVFVLAVGSSLGQRVENTSLAGAEPSGGTPLLLGLVSVPHLAIALAAVVVIALLRRRPKVALRVLVIVAVANVAGQLLKYHVLSRPALTDLTSINTFPSGHTIVFTSVLVALLMALPAVLRPVAALGGVAVLSVAVWELLQYGWHRPSDVIGGMLLVICLAASVVLVSGRSGRVPARLSTKVVVGLLLVLAGLALVAALIVGVLLLLDGRPVDSTLLLRAGQLGSIAVCCVTVAVGLWLPPE